MNAADATWWRGFGVRFLQQQKTFRKIRCNERLPATCIPLRLPSRRLKKRRNLHIPNMTWAIRQFFILTRAKDELAALVVHGKVDEQHGTLGLDRQPSQYSKIFFQSFFDAQPAQSVFLCSLCFLRCVLAWIRCNMLFSYSTHKYSKGLFKGQIAWNRCFIISSDLGWQMVRWDFVIFFFFGNSLKCADVLCI